MIGGKKISALLRGLWRYYVPVLVYILLSFLLFRYANIVADQNTQLSLRYVDMPIPAATASQINDKMSDPAYTGDFGVCFWREVKSMQLETDYGKSSTGAVYADGEMNGVYPASFLYGSYPTAIDAGGIAVSEGLAWQLWGGGDIVGTEVEWDSKTYVIRGVFEGVDPMILFQVNSLYEKDVAYTGVELYGTPESGDPREAAEAFANEIGLGTPNAVVSGPSLAGLLLFMAMVPALILIAWFIGKVMGQLHRLPYWPRQALWFVLLLAIALAIPYLLNMLPAWVIPNKWSDLDAWSVFFINVNERVREWLALYPSFRDVGLKLQLIRQVLLLIPCLFATTVTIRVWNARIAKNTPVPQPAPEEDAEPEAGETDGDWDVSLPDGDTDDLFA